MALPMLADLSLRLAAGLAAALLVVPWRVVPAAFFRTQCLVVLGLLVLAVLVLGRQYATGLPLGIAVSAAVLAYLASAVWGLGLPRLAMPLSAMIAAGLASLLVVASCHAEPDRWVQTALTRLVSACLLGSTLTAMLLGHHYLTAPAMSIAPLRRFVFCFVAALAVRAILAAIGLVAWFNRTTGLERSASSGLFLLMRWGMGFAAPALSAYMAWKTVEIRSTQSATGILYIAMTLVLFGELSALVLSQGSSFAF
jgi:hypothetical protein